MEVKWCLIVVLIYISLMTNAIEYLSCSYWPFLHLLWWKVFSNICPFKKLGHFPSYYTVLRILYILCIEFFIRYIICKYFLPVTTDSKLIYTLRCVLTTFLSWSFKNSVFLLLIHSLSLFRVSIRQYNVKIPTDRASLVAQWLRICLPMQGTRVRALVWEDPTCHGAAGPMSRNCWACASGACALQQERPR